MLVIHSQLTIENIHIVAYKTNTKAIYHKENRLSPEKQNAG